MSDSPAEKNDPAATGSEPAQKAIPKARLDEVLGQKKQLAEQLSQVQKELEQLKGGGTLDVEKLTKTMAEVAVAAAEAATTPFKQEAEKLRMGARLGLQSEEQINLVASYVNKGLDEQEALLLARSKNKEKFADSPRPYDPRIAGMVPPGGISATRSTEEKPVDYRAKIAEEMRKERPDVNMAKNYAMQAFHEAITRGRKS